MASFLISFYILVCLFIILFSSLRMASSLMMYLFLSFLDIFLNKVSSNYFFLTKGGSNNVILWGGQQQSPPAPTRGLRSFSLACVVIQVGPHMRQLVFPTMVPPRLFFILWSSSSASAHINMFFKASVERRHGCRKLLIIMSVGFKKPTPLRLLPQLRAPCSWPRKRGQSEHNGSHHHDQTRLPVSFWSPVSASGAQVSLHSLG